ncbi:MAG: FixH family protein [Phycisphaerales bacterium]|nr:FixH family protein [Phycisphaerales bacterium]
MSEQKNPKELSAFKRYLATGKHWPIMLLVLFLTQASIVLGTAIVASGRGSLPLESGYYAKSLDWDTEHAARKRAAELGWTITTTLGMPEGVYKERLMSISLTDKDGQPITDALVSVRVFHGARSDEKIKEVLPMSADGVYSKGLKMVKPGLWDLQITIRALGEDALVTEIIEVGR